MSEVHRYQVVTMLSAEGATIGYDPHGPDVVMAAEFDRVTAENSALQARLTAADERADRQAALTNDDLIKIARTAAVNSVDRYNYMPCIPEEAYAWEPHYWVIEAMRAALSPAEPAKDAHVCTGCGSKGWTANCAECVPY